VLASPPTRNGIQSHNDVVPTVGSFLLFHYWTSQTRIQKRNENRSFSCKEGTKS
jgi:hypothetical protein